MNNNKNISRPLLYKVNVTWTGSEEVIIKYLNSYESKTFILTQKELALETHTSEPTISRFCKKYGFNNYKSFVFYFNQVLLEFNQEYPIDQKSASYSINNLLSKNMFALKNTLNYVTMEEISKASSMIVQSKKIVVIGQGFSERIAYELASNLLKIGLNIFWNNDIYTITSIIANGKSDDLYIMFSNKTQEQKVSFILEEIKKTGGKIILISPDDSKIIKNAIDIKIEYEKIEDEKELIPTASKISQSIIADALFESIINKKPIFKLKLLKSLAVWKRWSNL